ncbi:hypothetical protein [Rhizobium sp. P32RR-XVIII]|uniref:hypothetical protein n=1 Tax=Rhizobium sp. P32RR-XVIII TaxID=2726738 RepID=UPI00391827EC
MTKGTVYLYFPTKDVLFQEMLRNNSASSADLATAIDSLRESCADRLRALLRRPDMSCDIRPQPLPHAELNLISTRSAIVIRRRDFARDQDVSLDLIDDS